MFELPDTVAALPPRPFTFSPWVDAEAAELLASPPDRLFHRLLREQESQATLLAARRILHTFLTSQNADSDEEITDLVGAARTEITASIAALTRTDPAATTTGARTITGISAEIAAQRAPLALLDGCWLDVVSQAATQPSVIVNRMYAQYFTLRGAGDPLRSVEAVRRRALADAGVVLPDLGAADFATKAQARPLTLIHACFLIALSRLPATFLPEVVGVHYAVHALGVDDLLLGTEPPLPDVSEVLAEYVALAGPDERRRLRRAVALVVSLEREHVAMLGELAAWRSGLTLESQVAEIVARHAPMAGRQHRDVRVGGRLLSEIFSDPDLDVADFLTALRESPLVRPTREGGSRLVDAMRFGGPMFGIFDEQESAVFKRWVRSVQAGERPTVEISVNAVGDERAGHWREAIAGSAPSDVVFAEAGDPDDRELFHRLVNIESFPNTLPVALRRAERVLTDAEVLFVHGSGGRYTDATFFDFTPEALYERCERIYWDKLVRPYVPLTEIPDRDMVIFLQTTYALGALIDGTWLHRLANTGHRTRPSDEMLFTIYADEMGHGDLRKNHLTLIHTALASMGVRLPHIRDDAFMAQAELPDELYGFSLHQLCLALFPDRFHNELLGYNLAIEMFGLGELRLHEIQKLRHYGFDDCYERAHLTIDNLSAGHSRQAADIIVTYLDTVERTVGAAAVPHEWRRIWRGYASYAYFVEHALLKEVKAGEAVAADDRVAADEAAPADVPADDDLADLVI